jgi:hypothetical protein
MKNKITKMKCAFHEDNRDISEYIFWHIDKRKKNHIIFYECKKCKEHLNKTLDRQRRIKEHNKKQEEIAYNRMVNRIHKKQIKRQKSIKEDLWDFVVENELCKGIKLHGQQRQKYIESIPKEVIQYVRAVMKLQRLIEDKKKSIQDSKKEQIRTFKENEEKKRIEIERLNRPLVKCKKHGSLFRENVIQAGKNKSGSPQFKCKQCQHTMHSNYYEKNKEKVLKKCANYRHNNPEKVKQWRINYKEKLNG